mmetsp:Transcript_118765/g.378777  ORF Transcript_118765/g.378777 Transcript_118765/m.378777 type:complete len:399 (+) Transcript_118765:365-1561(+)
MGDGEVQQGGEQPLRLHRFLEQGRVRGGGAFQLVTEGSSNHGRTTRVMQVQHRACPRVDAAEEHVAGLLQQLHSQIFGHFVRGLLNEQHEGLRHALAGPRRCPRRGPAQVRGQQREEARERQRVEAGRRLGAADQRLEEGQDLRRRLHGQWASERSGGGRNMRHRELVAPPLVTTVGVESVPHGVALHLEGGPGALAAEPAVFRADKVRLGLVPGELQPIVLLLRLATDIEIHEKPCRARDANAAAHVLVRSVAMLGLCHHRRMLAAIVPTGGRQPRVAAQAPQQRAGEGCAGRGAVGGRLRSRVLQPLQRPLLSNFTPGNCIAHAPLGRQQLEVHLRARGEVRLDLRAAPPEGLCRGPGRLTPHLATDIDVDAVGQNGKRDNVAGVERSSEGCLLAA